MPTFASSIEHKRLCEVMGGRDVRAPYESESLSKRAESAVPTFASSIEHKRLCEVMGGRDVRAPYESES
ncbi:MAG: hypothetical protein K2X77_10630, partial [Candidatus Obscuribacterales bacterium]|nr:hypothetical protein [Candidatus Obscuribacterales bacterium]